MSIFKRIILAFIKLYQQLAPKTLRESCRFEPSCSNYMIMAIDKYGILKGVVKGFRRILNCKYPNGGIDYP
ncbi:MAG: membrane protein insertion efficiency factor YidD [Deltaproteobacteria bacterium]|nr:membrane protein insertion efficiency factor YidD [Deltaproteobacteria bacterium]